MKPVTAAYLRNVVRWYLERHDAPVAHVRRLLLQRVHRAARAHGQDVEEGTRLVDALLAELVEGGLLDDARWAEATARRLRARGQPERRVRAAMSAKGVGREVIDAALAPDEDDEDPPDEERLAAIRYARRRRFGPWRRPDAPEDAARRELASMARAGFPLHVAREVLRAEDAAALEDELPVGW